MSSNLGNHETTQGPDECLRPTLLGRHLLKDMTILHPQSEISRSLDGKRPRVLLVSHALPPHLGGIEVVVEEEADALSLLGLDVSVVSSSWGQSHDRLTRWSKQTVPALNLLEGRFGVPFPIFGPSLVSALVPAVRRADVVHIHDVFYLSSLVAGVAAVVLRKPLVLTQHVDMIPHTSRLVEAAQRVVFRTYGRFLFSTSSRVLVLNDRVQEFVARGGAAPDRIEFLPNGVDVEAFRPPIESETERLRVGLGLPRDRVLVLFAGRPVPKKGFDIFVDCASPEYDLVFVGGERRPMEVTRNGGRLYFLGSVPRVQMPEIYRAVDVFCLPSVGEGFPLTVQEAMASGLPVVTTADEAYRRYEVPPDAVCFVRREAVAMSQELSRLARDPDSRIEIGRRAREHVMGHFSWEVHARRLTQVYREAQLSRVQPPVPEEDH
jgi:glycosyltransferase involved in cell wall biosynthesis